MLETWDWYIDRFIDMPVADVVSRRVFREPTPVYSESGVTFVTVEPRELRYRAEDIDAVKFEFLEVVFLSLALHVRKADFFGTSCWWPNWKATGQKITD